MEELLSGTISDPEIITFLVAMREKGEQTAELVGFAEVMRARVDRNDRGDIVPPRGRGGVTLGGVLGAQPREVCTDFGVRGVPLEELPHVRPRVREEDLMDELDGRGRALDVQQDGADVFQLDAARSGMYVGPMQSGW